MLKYHTNLHEYFLWTSICFTVTCWADEIMVGQQGPTCTGDPSKKWPTDSWPQSTHCLLWTSWRLSGVHQLVWLLMACTGAQCRECYWGVERVRAGDGKGYSTESSWSTTDQGTRPCTWRHCRRFWWGLHSSINWLITDISLGLVKVNKYTVYF